jgi:serine/threonine protein kinase
MLGETVGDYRILSRIGEGGMGQVYLAEHTRLCRRAAIKILRPELAASAAAVERLLAEARATALIRHPTVVEVFDCDVHRDGRAYLAMEYLEGETLAALLARGGGLVAETETALAVVAKLAAGLAAAHERGLVHRDIKPENVFLVYEGGTAVKLLDFGVARSVGPGTPEGAFVGTPAYMSPEQCRGAGLVGIGSDVYSLGCVLFEMLCGRPPFLRGSPGELLAAHLVELAPRASAFSAAVPAALDDLLLRALAKNPDQRQPTMAALIEDLHRCVPPERLEGALDRSAAIERARQSWRRPGPAPSSVEGVRSGRRTIEMGASTLAPRPGEERPPRPGRASGRRRLLVLGLAAAGVLVARPLFRRPRPARVPVAAKAARSCPSRAGQTHAQAVAAPVAPPRPSVRTVSKRQTRARRARPLFHPMPD